LLLSLFIDPLSTFQSLGELFAEPVKLCLFYRIANRVEKNCPKVDGKAEQSSSDHRPPDFHARCRIFDEISEAQKVVEYTRDSELVELLKSLRRRICEGFDFTIEDRYRDYLEVEAHQLECRVSLQVNDSDSKN
jgi:hypothetical protein